jgi:glycosyltransferase involved in cell wall biosynthesis
MKVSIITVCKNSELHIEKAIKSVISQSYKDIEYIIIDGNSQDKTKEIVAKYGDHITYFVSEPDDGLYEAMNKGIKIATGSFINFLNSDDYFYDRYVIQDVINFIEFHPDCDFVYGDTHIRPDPKISNQSSILKPPLPSELAQAMIYGNLFVQGAVFTKHKLFSSLGIFSMDYKVSADFEWFTRLLQDSSLSIYYYPRTIFSFYQGGFSCYQGGQSGSTTTAQKEMFEIQNNLPVYQSVDWQKLRILRLQTAIIQLQDLTYKFQSLAEKRKVLIEKMSNPFYMVSIQLFFKLKLSIKSLIQLFLKLKSIVKSLIKMN